MRTICVLVVLALMAGAGVAKWLADANTALDRPLPLPAQGVTYVVQPGDNLRGVAEVFTARGWLKKPLYLTWWGRWTGGYPERERAAIDELNDYVADRLNDGVYRCLLAKNQEDYELAFDRLFAALDTLDDRLATRRYLLGAHPTEPDWRLFACLVRFDPIYYSLYKCNLRRIVDYANLWDYTRDLYQLPGVAVTVDLERIKAGYYGIVSRGGIVPKGPLLDFNAPHTRSTI